MIVIFIYKDDVVAIFFIFNNTCIIKLYYSRITVITDLKLISYKLISEI